MKTISPAFNSPLMIFLTLLMLGTMTYLAKGHCDTLDRVVAVVNNEAIPESELNQQLQMVLSELRQNPNETMQTLPQNQLKKQLLDKIVLEKLQLQKAKETKILVEDNELNRALEDIASRNNITLKQLQTAQEERGVPFAKFRDIVKNQLIISRLQQRELGQNIHVSPEEIDQFLNSAQGQDQTGAEYRLSHILIPISDKSSRAESRAKAQVDSILQQLKSGVDFSKLAVDYSNNSSLPGGDLGFRKTAELPTLFVKIVPTLKVGEVRGPIRNDSGFHLIKLVEKRIDGVLANKTFKKIHARHILIKTNEKMTDQEAQALLNKIREQCLAGNDFGKLALKHSEEPSSVSKGGDLGWIMPNSVEPELYQSISQLPPGDISQPFKTNSGWHLVQVLEARQSQVTSEATRSKAQELLFQRKVEQRMITWLKRVRDEAEVQIYLNEA